MDGEASTSSVNSTSSVRLFVQDLQNFQDGPSAPRVAVGGTAAHTRETDTYNKPLRVYRHTFR